MKAGAVPLVESRLMALRRFKSLESSLRGKGQFLEFVSAGKEYFHMQHAEPIPESELKKPHDEDYYLPMHLVKKESSMISKIRVVFDASAKMGSGTSLNYMFLVGPTVILH